MNKALVNKYNIPGPRYTSYPTVPYWDEDKFTSKQWKNTYLRAFKDSNQSEGISVYIHLPFCENLCTFCACHKRITKRHEVEKPYIQTVLKEWEIYVDSFGEKPIIKELHLGGGTPTFFSTENLKTLLEGIYSRSEIHPEKEFSFEGHPNNTSKDHLQVLFDLGFNRVSFGVQDYDLRVQKAINRIQPEEKVAQVTQWSKEIGYESISHDIVFGLPFQHVKSIVNTIEITKKYKPDRISFYSYAHVPWIKGIGQRGFSDKDLPSGDEKRQLYEKGKLLLEEMGYIEIGMDHFALKKDSLYKAIIDKKLHRNFMGYTSSKTHLMVGLGVSSISDSWFGFAQNEKTVEAYQKQIQKNELSVYRGHILTQEDLSIRQHILNLMCQFETEFSKIEMENYDWASIRTRLDEMEKDGLINLSEGKIKINKLGRPFVRNVCMAIDIKMLNKSPNTRIFSMTI